MTITDDDWDDMSTADEMHDAIHRAFTVPPVLACDRCGTMAGMESGLEGRQHAGGSCDGLGIFQRAEYAAAVIPMFPEMAVTDGTAGVEEAA